ncbi:MAG: hypothetical protein JWN44_1516 [Myxococcales bacterium]|nr:hypothetical protein [Myxococcales bacterium]
MKLAIRISSMLALATLAFGIIGCGGETTGVNPPAAAQESALMSIAADPDVQQEVTDTGSAMREISTPESSAHVVKGGGAVTNATPRQCVCCKMWAGRVQCNYIVCGTDCTT